MISERKSNASNGLHFVGEGGDHRTNNYWTLRTASLAATLRTFRVVQLHAQSYRVERRDGDDSPAHLFHQFRVDQFVQHQRPGVFWDVDAGGQPQARAVLYPLGDHHR